MISHDSEGREYWADRPTGRVRIQTDNRGMAIDFTPAARELGRAVQKQESKAQAILEELRRGPASTSTLARIGGVRFGARICELRQQGHKIVTEGRADYAIYKLEE